MMEGIRTLMLGINAEGLFYYSQWGLAVIFVVAFWFLRKPTFSNSGFRLREADRLRNRMGSLLPSRLTRKPSEAGAEGQAKPKPRPAPRKPAAPFRLTGIRIDGPSHEVLGVSPQATPAQIQKAYRELMKRYHPDRVGRPGTREWNDAQKIAEAINRAKDDLLKRAQK